MGTWARILFGGAVIASFMIAGCASVNPVGRGDQNTPASPDERSQEETLEALMADIKNMVALTAAAGSDTRGDEEAGASVPLQQGARQRTSPRAELDLTPFISVALNGHADRSEEYAGLYTRLRATGFLCEDQSNCDPSAFNANADGGTDGAARTRTNPDARNYNAERRNWMQRLVWGQRSAKSAVMSVRIEEVGLEATVPLLTVSHESTRETGEQFVTMAGLALMPTQYFRIVPGARVQMEISARMSNEVSSDAVSNTLDTATRAVNLVASQSTLLTALSRDQVASAASFVDQTLSTLLAEGVEETVPVSAAVEDWINDDLVVNVVLRLPRNTSRSPIRVNNDQLFVTGVWRIEMEDPRISIWSSTIAEMPSAGAETRGGANGGESGLTAPAASRWMRYAHRVAPSLSYLTPSEVLGLTLANNVTLGDRLASRDWRSAALTELATADATKRPNAAANLCRRITQEAVALGFNSLDAHIILWASAHAPDIRADMTDAILTADGGCAPERDYIAALGLMRTPQAELAGVGVGLP